MKITSPAFETGKAIPSEYTCEGLGCNPELHFRGVPAQTVSLVLIMDDPDVPKHIREDCMWDHWVVFNIPPETRLVKRNTESFGVDGINTAHGFGYYAPCPPDRRHRYFFKLYALDTILSLPQGASKKDVLVAITGHVIAEAELMGTYEKHHTGET